MKEQELLFKKRLQDLARTAYFKEIPVFTDFLDLNELHMVHSFQPDRVEIHLHFFGGYEGAERQIAAFLPDALSYDEDFCKNLNYPLTCLKISPMSKKFSETLTHRDFLGALLHLGIQRSMLGDLVLKDQDCYVFCLEHMKEFLLTSLEKVRHTNVKIQEVKDPQDLPQPELTEIHGTVASVRLDSMIALAFSSSRNRMLGLIEGGKVFVNGKMVVSNGHTLKPGDIVTVRGYGKFRYENMKNITKKGRCSVVVSRYGKN